HDGEHFRVEGVTLRPKPVQDHVDVWLGGTSPSELRRTGRLGDGWLPSFTVPAEVEAGWATITAVAAEHGRTIDPEHLGVLVPYVRGELPPAVAAVVSSRRPDFDPRDVVPSGVDGLRRQLQRFVAVGASKFVGGPVGGPPDGGAELGGLAAGVPPLGTCPAVSPVRPRPRPQAFRRASAAHARVSATGTGEARAGHPAPPVPASVTTASLRERRQMWVGSAPRCPAPRGPAGLASRTRPRARQGRAGRPPRPARAGVRRQRIAA